MTSKAVVVMSGGLDSTTMAYLYKSRGYDIHAISFNYGQRHQKELGQASHILHLMGAADNHKIVDMGFIPDLFVESGSSLVTDEEVPEGHYAADNMKATVVPNRNMIMLSIAAGYAVSVKASILATGVHAGDHFIYPDCRPEFIAAARASIEIGNDGFYPPYLEAPFLNMSKNQIAVAAHDLGVPIELTWSCYKGGDIHCGKCGTCVERREALESVKDIYRDFEDPTEYEDRDYWKTVVKS